MSLIFRDFGANRLFSFFGYFNEVIQGSIEFQMSSELMGFDKLGQRL